MLQLFEGVEEVLIGLEDEEAFDFLILEVEDFVDVVCDALEGLVLVFSGHELVAILVVGLFFLMLLLLFLVVLTEIDFNFFLWLFHHLLVLVL